MYGLTLALCVGYGYFIYQRGMGFQRQPKQYKFLEGMKRRGGCGRTASEYAGQEEDTAGVLINIQRKVFHADSLDRHRCRDSCRDLRLVKIT